MATFLIILLVLAVLGALGAVVEGLFWLALVGLGLLAVAAAYGWFRFRRWRTS